MGLDQNLRELIARDVQQLISWWCTLLGITDPVSIQVANGIIGAASLLFVVFIVLTMAFGLMASLLRIGWPPRGTA